MLHKKLAKAFILFTMVFLFSSQYTFACSYYPKWEIPVAFEYAEKIVVAKIVSVEKIVEDENNDGLQTGLTKMVVEKVYKGDAKIGDELIFGQSIYRECYWNFTEKMIGEKFLFYDMKRSFMPNVIPSSGLNYLRRGGRSWFSKYAANDLLFLEKIDKVLGKTRLSGRLEGVKVKGSGFANRQIKIIGKDKVYQTKTNKDGVFEIYDLPPGEYLVEPEIPDKLKLSSFSLIQSKSLYNRPKKNEKVQIPVELKEKGNEELELYFSIDNSIRGKILSPAGNPIRGIGVTTIRAEKNEMDFEDCFMNWNSSGKDGSFEINGLYPGDYILVINECGKVSPDEPFGRFFYPGVTDRKDAKVVSIDFGQFLNDINIQIPKAEEFIEISGRALYSDRTPVFNGIVRFETVNENSRVKQNTGVRTDEKGHFSLEILKNVRGNLYGEINSYDDKFDDCREYVKALAQEETDWIKTTEIKIQEKVSLTGIELILPFSGCPKTIK